MEHNDNSNAKDAPWTALRGNQVSERCVILGENVRHARKERGFTSQVLADFLQISTAYVGLIERGERCPSLDTFLKICEFFGETAEGMLSPKAPRLAVAEAKAAYSRQEGEALAVERKIKMITCMLSTFTADELDHVVGAIKSFKSFSNKSEGQH